MSELQKKKDTYRKLMAGRIPNTRKPQTHISPEKSRAIYDAWIKDNGNTAFEKLASRHRVTENHAYHAVDIHFAEAFPKLIEFFGK